MMHTKIPANMLVWFAVLGLSMCEPLHNNPSIQLKNKQVSHTATEASGKPDFEIYLFLI